MAASNGNTTGDNVLKMADELVNCDDNIQLSGDLNVPTIQVTDIDQGTDSVCAESGNVLVSDSTESGDVLVSDSAAPAPQPVQAPVKDSFLSTLSLRLTASSENVSSCVSETCHIVVKKTESHFIGDRSKSDTDLTQIVAGFSGREGVKISDVSSVNNKTGSVELCDVSSVNTKTGSDSALTMDTQLQADGGLLGDTNNENINTDDVAKELTPVGNACAEDKTLDLAMLSSSVKRMTPKPGSRVADFDATPMSHAVSEGNLARVLSVHVPGDDHSEAVLSKSSDNLTAHSRRRVSDDVTSSEDIFVDCADDMYDHVDRDNVSQIPENKLETQGVIMEDFMRILEFNTSLTPAADVAEHTEADQQVTSSRDDVGEDTAADEQVTSACVRHRTPSLAEKMSLIDALTEPIDENVNHDDDGDVTTTKDVTTAKNATSEDLILPELDLPAIDDLLTPLKEDNEGQGHNKVSSGVKKAPAKRTTAKSKLKKAPASDTATKQKHKTATTTTTTTAKRTPKSLAKVEKGKKRIKTPVADDYVFDDNNNSNMNPPTPDSPAATSNFAPTTGKAAQKQGKGKSSVAKKRFSLDDDFLKDPIKAKEKRELEFRESLEDTGNAAVVVSENSNDVTAQDTEFIADGADDDMLTVKPTNEADAVIKGHSEVTKADDVMTVSVIADEDDAEEKDQDEFIQKVSADWTIVKAYALAKAGWLLCSPCARNACDVGLFRCHEW